MFVLGALILLAGVLANLNYRYVSVARESRGNFPFTPPLVLSDVDYFLAGFPMTYRTSIEASESSALTSAELRERRMRDADGSDQPDPGRVVIKRWYDPMAIVGNVLGWLVAAIGVGALVGWTRRWKLTHLGRSRSVADMVVAGTILACPLAFLGYHWVRIRQQDALVDRISGQGIAVMSTWLPEVIADQVPKGLRGYFARVRGVSLDDPSEALMQEVARLPQLTSLLISQSKSVESLSQPSACPMLSSVGFVRTTLTDSHAGFFDRHPQLTHLTFAGVAVDRETFAPVCRLPNIRVGSFRYGFLPLDQLSEAKWKTCAERLVVAIGYEEGERVEFDHWPKLSKVSLVQNRVQAPAWPTIVRVRDCEKFRELGLDSFRFYDLVLENNPRLEKLDTFSSVDSAAEFSTFFANIHQFSNLRICNCPRLDRLDISVTRLEEFDVRTCGALKSVHVGSIVTTSRGSFRRRYRDVEMANQVIEELGATPSLRELRLQGIPISECDLSLLSNNPGLRSLGFTDTYPLASQVMELEPLQQLVELDLGMTQLGEEEINFVLNAFPRLENITFDASSVEAFSLSEESSVENLLASPFVNVRSFDVSAPKLDGGFHLGRGLERVSIENSPRITTLVIDSPLPDDHHLEGFRDLRTFMVGGGNVDDEVIDAIGGCDNLERLMLAFTGLSADGLKRIGEFVNLRSLAVPGNHVNDEILESWARLTELWNLDLSYNRDIGAEAIGWASRNASLRYLKLDHTRLRDRVISLIPELKQVTHLSLAQVNLDAEQLEQILLGLNLEYLNLSGIRLTDAHLDALVASPQPVDRLVVRSCGLTRRQVLEFLDRQPKGRVDAGRLFKPLEIERMRSRRDPLASRLLSDGLISSFHHSQRMGSRRGAFFVSATLSEGPDLVRRAVADMRFDQRSNSPLVGRPVASRTDAIPLAANGPRRGGGRGASGPGLPGRGPGPLGNPGRGNGRPRRGPGSQDLAMRWSQATAGNRQPEPDAKSPTEDRSAAVESAQPSAEAVPADGTKTDAGTGAGGGTALVANAQPKRAVNVPMPLPVQLNRSGGFLAPGELALGDTSGFLPESLRTEGSGTDGEKVEDAQDAAPEDAVPGDGGPAAEPGLIGATGPETPPSGKKSPQSGPEPDGAK